MSGTTGRCFDCRFSRLKMQATIPCMYRHLPFSPIRVLGSVIVAFVIASACTAGIHFSGGKVWPLVELAVCCATAAALALSAPHFGAALKSRRLKHLVRRPLKSHLTTAKDLLLTPRRLQFSVQAGLIYLSVLCLWLGFSVNRMHRLEMAAKVIEQAGGRVTYDSPRMFGEVRAVFIARRSAPADDATLLGLIPHVRALRPRRIIIGSRASATVVGQFEAAFPSAEIVVRGSTARN